MLASFADVVCEHGDSFRVLITDGGMQIWDSGQWRDTTLVEANRRHLTQCEWLTADVDAENMFELHPPGTRIRYRGDVYLVGDDLYWRNKLGMEPAGQRTPPPEAARHCKGCRCGEQGQPRGRMSHGGGL